MTNKLQEMLSGYKTLGLSNREVGDKFEDVVKSYLEIDNLYKNRYSEIWKWDNWPLKETKDCGIDLVAKISNTDDCYCAIQCKFYDKERQISKYDVDSFLSESGKKNFKERLFVSTTDKWSKLAENAIKNQTIPITRIGLNDLYESSIDWSKFNYKKSNLLQQKEGYKKTLRPHQKEALDSVIQGFNKSDRGKLIMACGTGKTFTALKIIEKIVEKKSMVLFLVPSLSLLSQTLKEWSEQKERNFDFYAVCSDSKVTKNNEDISASDVIIPATTDYKKLANNIEKSLKNKDTDIIAILATYQSIDVVIKAQKQSLPQLALIICDEAHRTTGVEREKTSHFLKVHSNENINAQKRLYMTATPRIYSQGAKKTAETKNIDYFCMDDYKTYGQTFHNLSFGEAVERDLLTDYQVLIFTVYESYANQVKQKETKEEDITLDVRGKIIGCFKALEKKVINYEKLVGNNKPMQRAVAFSGDIENSENVTKSFQEVIEALKLTEPDANNKLKIEIQHVDGKQNALERNQKLSWLKENIPSDQCRILSNARCLSEGIDVPALDAVMFLKPRKSTVDIVQSVGRVMRKYDGKKMGYIILPVTIPLGANDNTFLQNHEHYSHIWQVINALRSHDERLDIEINKIDLNNESSKIKTANIGGESKDENNFEQQLLNLQDIEKHKRDLFAKIAEKCGTRKYWETWAKDIEVIACRHIELITEIIKKNTKAKKSFETFLSNLQKNINESIQEAEAIEMLAQHLISQPVFNALFNDDENYNFATNNPVSKGIESVLNTFSDSLKIETQKLEGFYESVHKRAEGIDNATGKQRVIVELYDKFFKNAFPKMAERLGIVYTPIEIVDFIIRSSNDVLKQDFNRSLNDKNVHILDPFTGTGTFITRLIQSGLIAKQRISEKYKKEIHANEIVLLAYYIATVNIEMAFHFATTKEKYTPFNGICLTDTFNMFENSDANQILFPELEINTERIDKLKETPLTVIIGNPPYSVGQRSANDNNQNIKHPKLDKKIQDTYFKLSKAQKNNIDSYKKAIRFATDRIEQSGQGIVSFITNASFLDSSSDDGLRKSLVKDFDKIYIFNLRGNQRTSGETSRKEGGKIFGGGSRTPTCIFILVKKAKDSIVKKLQKILMKVNVDKVSSIADIYYYDIGDYLKREEKLKIVKEFGSIKNLPFKKIIPNKYGDWLNQRNNENYETYTILGDKKNPDNKIFLNYTCGVATSRDAWVYNFSKEELIKNVQNTIDFYNLELDILNEKINNISMVKDLVNNDKTKISWSRDLYKLILKKQTIEFNSENIRLSLYRPFCKQYLYYDKNLNEEQYQIPNLMPQKTIPNIFIGVVGKGKKKGFTPFITNITPNLDLIAGGQWFAMYSYTKNTGLFKSTNHEYERINNIPDEMVTKFKNTYSNENITREDIFYYIYGLLHAKDYQSEFFDFITKEIPRIPMVKKFSEFSTIGKKLADLHLNYEDIKPMDLNIIHSKPEPQNDNYYYVDKMKLSKDKIVYNHNITIENIPSKAYEYVVNGKSAIEWIIDRYQIKKDKESLIVNNPNSYESSKYIFDLLLKVITVSIKSVDLINSLPKIDIN